MAAVLPAGRARVKSPTSSAAPGHKSWMAMLADRVLELDDPGSIALLQHLDLVWPQLPTTVRSSLLASLVLLPPSPVRGEHADAQAALLPGGALAWHDETGRLLVCDPESATAFAGDAARRLRRELAGIPAAFSVQHAPDGARLVPGVAAALRGPSATLLPSGAPVLAGSFGAASPAMVVWHQGGAVAWALAEAPGLVGLAAALTGVPLLPEQALARELWAAEDALTVFQLISLALAMHLDDLLALDVSDSLRWALRQHACSGPDSLASGLADVLQALPSALPAVPGTGRKGKAGEVMLSLADVTMARRAVLGLRAALGNRAARLRRTGGEVDLAADAALFAAQPGTLRVLMAAPPDGPVGLYALAHEIAGRCGATVTAVAPCWGFQHRIDADGRTETGNAAWFGMGPTLDELGDILSIAP